MTDDAMVIVEFRNVQVWSQPECTHPSGYCFGLKRTLNFTTAALVQVELSGYAYHTNWNWFAGKWQDLMALGDLTFILAFKDAQLYEKLCFCRRASSFETSFSQSIPFAATLFILTAYLSLDTSSRNAMIRWPLTQEGCQRIFFVSPS